MCIHYRRYVCVGLHVCVLTPVVREERGNSRKKSALNEVWKVLGSGITVAHVHWKTQRRASAAKHIRVWESACLWLIVTSIENFSHI